MRKSKIKNPLIDFENQWVAMTPNHEKVLAAADTLRALDKVLVERRLEDTVLVKVLPFDVSLSP